MRTVWTVPAIAALVFVVDALTKSWALANLHEGIIRPFLPGLLNLTLTTNTGGAFGIGHEFKEVMTFLPLLICIGIVWWIVRRERAGAPLIPLEQVAFALVLGGALGNICDRLVRGRVTDFLDFAFMNFPIFNVADALIDVGVALVVLQTLMAPAPDKSNQTTGDGNA